MLGLVQEVPSHRSRRISPTEVRSQLIVHLAAHRVAGQGQERMYCRSNYFERGHNCLSTAFRSSGPRCLASVTAEHTAESNPDTLLNVCQSHPMDSTGGISPLHWVTF
jgi:hypothetical protein